MQLAYQTESLRFQSLRYAKNRGSASTCTIRVERGTQLPLHDKELHTNPVKNSYSGASTSLAPGRITPPPRNALRPVPVGIPSNSHLKTKVGESALDRKSTRLNSSH